MNNITIFKNGQYLGVYETDRYIQEVDLFRSKFLEACKPFKDWPIFLSGGNDSMAILAAVLELGGRPDLLHFKVTGWPSPEVERVEKVAAHYKLNLEIVKRDPTIENALIDLTDIMVFLARYRAYNPMRTTVAQCCNVTLRLVDRALELGWSQALMGVGGINDDTRACAVAYHESGDAGSDPLRRYTLLMGTIPLETEVNPINAEVNLAKALGIKIAQPFADPQFAEFLLSVPFKVVNYPKQKAIALRAFDEFFKVAGWKLNTNMHVGSGMREWHNSLLKTPLNPNCSQNVGTIYKDLLNSVRSRAANSKGRTNGK